MTVTQNKKTAKEFYAPINATQLKTNYQRLVKDCQIKTINGYLRKFFSLCSPYIPPAGDTPILIQVYNFQQILPALISNIADKRKNNCLKFSTLRTYKAVLSCAMSFMYMVETDPISVPTHYRELFTNHFLPTADELQSFYEQVQGWTTEKDFKEKDREVHRLAHTSTQKRKSFEPIFYQAVMDYSPRTENGKMLQNFIYLNCIFGLRPIEWLNTQLCPAPPAYEPNPLTIALIEQDFLQVAPPTTEQWLMVKNAKNSLGRACGSHRFLSVPNDPHIIGALNKFLTFINEFKQEYAHLNALQLNEHFEKKVLRNLSATLRRLVDGNEKCQQFIKKDHLQRLRVYENQRAKDEQNNKVSRRAMPPIAEYPSLYSTRHQAIANAKKAGYDNISIASMFGHASTLTAGVHYAKAQRGQFAPKTQVHAINIDIVVKNLPERVKQELSQLVGLQSGQDLSIQISDNSLRLSHGGEG